MSMMTNNDWYYHFKNGIPVGTNYGRGKWCYDCNFDHTPDRCMSNPANAEEWENHPQRLEDGKPRKPKGANMYQIYLVIKEDLRTEVSSVLVSGHESLSEAAEQVLVDFERLQDANEISASLDVLLKACTDMSLEDIESALAQIDEAIELVDEMSA